MMGSEDVNLSGVIMPPKDAPIYDIPALNKYCKEHGRDASTLTEDELKQFIVGHF